MENSTNIPIKNNSFKASIEATVEKIYKINGTEILELEDNELVITDKDCSLIELDIIINASTL